MAAILYGLWYTISSPILCHSALNSFVYIPHSVDPGEIFIFLTRWVGENQSRLNSEAISSLAGCIGEIPKGIEAGRGFTWARRIGPFFRLLGARHNVLLVLENLLHKSRSALS